MEGHIRAKSSLSIFAPKLSSKMQSISSYKISIFAFTKIVLEQRHLEMIAPKVSNKSATKKIAPA